MNDSMASQSGRVPWRVLAIIAALLAVAIGVARLLQQREQPPAWGTAHLFEGFVAIDGYALRAQAMREWIRGGDPGGVELSRFLQNDPHTTTVTIPAATAVLACTGVSVAWSYFAVVLVLFFATLHLGGRLAQELVADGAARADSYWLVWWYMALHATAARTVGQLMLDWGIAFAAAGCALYALRWARGGRWLDATAFTLFIGFGVFTKSSAMSVCVLPMLLAFAVARRGSRCRFVVATLAPALVGALAVAYSHFVAGAGLFERDHAIHLGTRVRPLEFGLEMLLLLQAGPLLLWRARPLSRPAAGVLVAVGVTYISVAVFRLPATPRLYLPTLALAIPLVVAVSWESLGRPRNAAAFAFVNLAITAAVFLRG